MSKLKSNLLRIVFLIVALTGMAPALSAQLDEARVREIAEDLGWKAEVFPENSGVRYLQGWVLDEFEEAPLGNANIVLVRGEEIVCRTFSDWKGHFLFKLDPALVKVEQLQVVVSFGGVTSVKAPIVLEEDVYALVAEVDIVLPAVRLSDYQPSPCGCWVEQLVIRKDPAVIYRPLDEFLMMNSSSIHHTGRW